MITKAEAINLHYGQELHWRPCVVTIGPQGGRTLKQERWRVSGACKMWKTRLNEFRVPIKHGMYQSAYLDQTNASDFHLASTCEPEEVTKDAGKGSQGG